MKLESLGIAAVPVATREFMTAARAQAGALGRADLDAVYVQFNQVRAPKGSSLGAFAAQVRDELRKTGAKTLVLTHLWEELGVDDLMKQAGEHFEGTVLRATPGMEVMWTS